MSRIIFLGLTVLALQAIAADFDPTKLPPPATVQVDFARDIKPIFEASCFRCHAGDKPKSNFRLTTREAALKGGTEGVDILPGQSAQSPLIYYVARLVPDMEMPPEGRGTPLTPEQVSLLRAWIDQGVSWEAQTNENKTSFAVSLLGGGPSVTGNKAKFRELSWMRSDWYGGLDYFDFQQRPTPDTRIDVAGHLLREDYKLTLSAEKNDLGFARFGWSQFRKYYDDTGGYYPLFLPSAFSLERNLYLDDGRAWVDFGLTLPRLPRIVLGYEFQYRDGSKSTLQWGPVISAGEIRNIFPAARDLSEKVHILKLDVDYEVAGVALSDSFRGEWYELSSQRFNDSSYTIGGAGFALTRADERQTWFQGANTVRAEKQFADWLYASGAYLYSKLSSDASLEVTNLSPAFLDPSLSSPGWRADAVQLKRESHIFSVSSWLGPWAGFTLSAAVQNEWTREEGLGGASVQVAVPAFPFVFDLPPETFRSDLDRSLFSQTVALRYSSIPHTVVFAEARLQEEQLGQYQEEIGGITPFLLASDTTSRLKDFRGGFNTSPWRAVSLSAHYRRRDKETDYDNFRKEISGQAFEGYPGFFRWRNLLSNEAEAKLSLRLASWFRSAITYSWIANDYRAETDPVSGGVSPGGSLLAGTYDSHLVSLGATVTPHRKLLLSATLTFQDARTSTAANDNPSIAVYKGPLYSALFNGKYALDPKTDLSAGYSFSSADFSQNNLAAGLPLGIQYQQHALSAGISHQYSHGETIGFQYRFYHYDEPSSGGIRDFDAHAVFATFSVKLQ